MTAETITNLILLFVIGLCAALALRRSIRAWSRPWMLLTLFYGAFFFSGLYWVLYLLFFEVTPRYFTIAELGWYVGYLFLLLLLLELRGDRRGMYRSPLSWLGPVFAAAMCLFYMHWGDYLNNIVSEGLMGALLWCAIGGLVYFRREPRCGSRCFYGVTLAFCLLEHVLWTLSCFWMGDTWANPYLWCDMLLGGCVTLFLPALRKAVEA